MNTNPEDDWIEQWWAATPENKLELIDGRLIISTLAGSRRVAWYLLADYGPVMALPLASPDLWWAALLQAFSPQPAPRTSTEWSEWATHFVYDPEPPGAGPFGSVEHRRVYQLLQFGLGYFTDMTGLGRNLGRDFVIRLGENGLTPDLLFVDRARLANLHEYYLDGPPTLTIEIILEGNASADLDRNLKRQLYEQAGISEYWLIEPTIQEVVFWRLGFDGRYHPAAVDDQGIYRSAAVPGLALSLPHLWTMDETDWQQRWWPLLPIAYIDHGPLPQRQPDPDELGWDSLPFAPRVDLQPVPIRFDEYVSWCPEAKFESYGGRMVIGGHEGTRRVSAMLLMSLGLVEVVKLAHPREWVAFLQKEKYQDMVQHHAEAIMRHARYESHEYRRDEVFFHGEIPQLDISEYGDTLAECQQTLAEAVSNWVLLRIARQQEIPRLE